MALSPTVYEMIFRYEYMQFKHTVDDKSKKDNTFLDERSPLKRASIGSKGDMRKEILGAIEDGGPCLFDEQQLREMVARKFEYSHSDQQHSIFKNMEILMKERQFLDVEYMNQSNFLETIKVAMRGVETVTTPEQFLIQTKYYTLITLKQILCTVLGNLIGNHDQEKINKSLQIIFSKIIELLQNDKK